MAQEALNARLDAYGRALRECAIVLEGRSPLDSAVTRAFGKLNAEFAALGDLAGEAARLTGEERQVFQQRVGQLSQEHAALVLSLSRDRERLLGLLHKGREARRVCRDTVTAGTTGGSCDLSA